jgi:hypothetical protein
MSPRSSAVLSANPSVGKCNLVPVADVLPEPSAAIDLIEEVTARELKLGFIPNCTTHVRLRYTEGPDRYVSFSPKMFTERDDYRDYRVVDLGRVYLDGVEREVWQRDPQLAEALEAWVREEEVAVR